MKYNRSMSREKVQTSANRKDSNQPAHTHSLSRLVQSLFFSHIYMYNLWTHDSWSHNLLTVKMLNVKTFAGLSVCYSCKAVVIYTYVIFSLKMKCNMLQTNVLV